MCIGGFKQELLRVNGAPAAKVGVSLIRVKLQRYGQAQVVD
jgi:hypothetical protein